MRNGRPDAIEAIYEQFRIFHGDAARTGALGPGGEGIVKICVKLHESHVARAWFEGKV